MEVRYCTVHLLAPGWVWRVKRVLIKGVLIFVSLHDVCPPARTRASSETRVTQISNIALLAPPQNVPADHDALWMGVVVGTQTSLLLAKNSQPSAASARCHKTYATSATDQNFAISICITGLLRLQPRYSPLHTWPLPRRCHAVSKKEKLPAMFS